jgi:hypothetical protein
VTPKTPSEHALECRRHAEEYAKDLHLVEFEEGELRGNYYLRGRWWSWVEIVVLRNGHLLVHGDLDAVIFGWCHGYSSPRGVLYWMTDAGPQYAAEKAHHGSSGKIAEEWDAEVALGYVEGWLADERITEDEAETLRHSVIDGSQQEFLEAVCGCKRLDCEDYEAGTVTAPQVFNAQAVLRRLVAELEARDFRNDARAWFTRAA